MMHRVFAAAPVLSLSLCAATLAYWVWSYRLTDTALCENRFGFLSTHAVPGGLYADRKAGIERQYFGTACWQIVLLTLVLPLWPLVRSCARWETQRKEILRRRLAARTGYPDGCCRSCGYDLRASKDRCPECGIAPSKLGRGG